MALNVVALQGRLGADPEIKFIGTAGTAAARVNIAVDIYAGKDPATGKTIYRPAWVTIKAFEGTAQLLADHWRKGDGILVTGTLDQDTWEDKETKQKRSVLYVRATRVDFVGDKRDKTNYDSPAEREAAERSAARQAKDGAASAPAPAADTGFFGSGEELNSEMPF